MLQKKSTRTQRNFFVVHIWSMLHLSFCINFITIKDYKLNQTVGQMHINKCRDKLLLMNKQNIIYVIRIAD